MEDVPTHHYFCPELGCLYQSTSGHGMKKHLGKEHEYTPDDLEAMSFWREQVCAWCQLSFGNIYEHRKHCQVRLHCAVNKLVLPEVGGDLMGDDPYNFEGEFEDEDPLEFAEAAYSDVGEEGGRSEVSQICLVRSGLVRLG